MGLCKKQILFISGIIFGLSNLAVLSWGQEKKKEMKPSRGQEKSSNQDPAVLNFDADVIEGEKGGPSIMVQMDLQAPTMDTLVFKRKNFNDFHAIDRKRKPKYRGQ